MHIPTEYRIVRMSDFHAARFRARAAGETCPDFPWTDEVESACASAVYKSYDYAFRSMKKVQALTGDVWAVLSRDVVSMTGRTTW